MVKKKDRELKMYAEVEVWFNYFFFHLGTKWRCLASNPTLFIAGGKKRRWHILAFGRRDGCPTLGRWHLKELSSSVNQDILRILWNPSDHYHVHNSSPLVPILFNVVAPSQPISVWDFNIISPSWSSKRPLWCVATVYGNGKDVSKVH